MGIIIPHLQVSKLRHRELVQLTQAPLSTQMVNVGFETVLSPVSFEDLGLWLGGGN